MSDAVLLALAAAAAFAGNAWLAVAMRGHWAQVAGGHHGPNPARQGLLRILGSGALLVAAALCLAADHIAMASLVFIMLLGVAALGVAMLLAWQPQLLRVFALVAAPGKR